MLLLGVEEEDCCDAMLLLEQKGAPNCLSCSLVPTTASLWQLLFHNHIGLVHSNTRGVLQGGELGRDRGLAFGSDQPSTSLGREESCTGIENQRSIVNNPQCCLVERARRGQRMPRWHWLVSSAQRRLAGRGALQGGELGSGQRSAALNIEQTKSRTLGSTAKLRKWRRCGKVKRTQWLLMFGLLADNHMF